MNIKERFLVDIAAAGGGWIEAGYQKKVLLQDWCCGEMVAEAFLFAVESTEYTSKWQNVQCMFMKRWFLYRKHSGVSKHSAIVSNGRPFRRHNMVAFVFVPAVVAQ